MSYPITFSAAGDCFITRRLPQGDSNAEALKHILLQGDVRFANLEVTTHRREGSPSAFSGGTWAMADPEVLDDLAYYSFNMLNGATNHTLDYLYGGMLATEQHVQDRGFVYAGFGSQLADASAPRYLDTPNGRTALIACTSTFHESWTAGEQSRDMPGRPGINPLRFDTTYTVSNDKLNQLRAVAEATYINADENLAVKEGFKTPSNGKTLRFGGHFFKNGTEEGKVRTVVPKDLKRLEQSVKEAERQAEYVIVSLHSHEMEKEDKNKPADFQLDFSRKMIDAGADSVICHGPHVVRGVEIYKGKPIFHGLGNFIFQNDTVTHLPKDFYEKYHLPYEANVADAFDARSDSGMKGLGINPDVWRSVIPVWKMNHGGLVEITFYPIDLGFGKPRYTRGWPKLTEDPSVLEHLQALSRPFGTKIEIQKDGTGVIRL
ncbi:CapA family protein [Alteribacillus sp. HJP-4]|uniref:CapA family protein n=1 Tax=Alteribacillus sp. HJP-4 TaxID=2775394 RepID=UPI0035CD2685